MIQLLFQVPRKAGPIFLASSLPDGPMPSAPGFAFWPLAAGRHPRARSRAQQRPRKDLTNRNSAWVSGAPDFAIIKRQTRGRLKTRARCEGSTRPRRSDWCQLRLQCSASDQGDEITLGQDADQTSVVDNR